MASITCPNCQAVLAADIASCPSCGSPQPGISTATASPVGTPPAPIPAPAPSAKPQIKFDWASLSHVDRLVGGGTLVLFISLFLPWFGFKFALGSVSWDGLTSHGYLYVTLFLSLGVLALLGAEATDVWKLPSTSPFTRDQLLLAATAVNLVLVVLAFLLKPGGYGFSGIGWKFGSFVGLIAAIVAAFPLGWPVIQARRAKR